LRTWAGLGIDVEGHESGNVKLACPSCGPTSKHPNKKDLSVDLDRGLYRCHNDGTGCGFQGSLHREQKVGPDPSHAAREWKRPVEEKYLASLKPMPDEVLAWFAGRGISRGTLEKLGVGWGPGWRDHETKELVDVILFPYRRCGELVNVKKRSCDKRFALVSGAEKVPFNLDARAKTTIWVEGEMDALALVEAGFPNVVSVPNGANVGDTAMEYLVAAQAELSEVEHHVLMLDDDEPGRALRDELARRFGRDRCSYVEYFDGRKDANEVLEKDGPDMLAYVVEHAVPYPIEEIQRPEQALVDLVTWKRDGMPLGLSTGLANLDACWRLVPGELTVVTGIPGHGKSQACDQLLINLAKLHEIKATVFSPEYHPSSKYMIGLVEKVTGKVFDDRMAARWRAKGHRCQVMDEGEMRQAVEWLREYFSFIVRQDDGLTLERILELARAEVYRRGIKVLVIDPWNEIEHHMQHGMTETLYISKCLSQVKHFAQRNDVHVLLVAHPTKMQSTVEKYTEEDDDGNEVQKQRLVYPVPSAYSISGGANWRNKADNVLILWRDVNAAAHGQNPHRVDCYVDKVRWKYDGDTGVAPLLWDPPTGRFRDADEEARPGPAEVVVKESDDDGSLPF
jgi:twinkle protein